MLALGLELGLAAAGRAQVLSHRGFVEARGTLFPQKASHDPRQVIGDVLIREELFVKATDWLRLSASGEARANSYGQVDASWRLRIGDRTARRPALNIRRLAATVSRGRWTLDLGKQFIRWGKVDIVVPTDRFAPRDYLNVVDSDFLAVRGGRVVFTTEHDSLEAVVVPWFTPSRGPLLDQRWTAVPAGVIVVEDSRVAFPSSVQAGARWSHQGRGYEYALAFFDGFNHLPNVRTFVIRPAPPTVAIERTYPQMRMYGADLAFPTQWVTVKAEAAYFTTTTTGTDEFVLHVTQIERQTGEWLIIGGYAGSVVTRRGGGTTFAPDRGMTSALIARASYAIDPNRSAAAEAAIRQNGDGVYLKGEYSTARGAHWRSTLSGALIRGDVDDFLGQFRRNSYLSLSVRYSF